MEILKNIWLGRILAKMENWATYFGP